MPRRSRRYSHDERPDAVMHLAAESHVDRSIDGPGVFVETNVVGTFRLLNAALDYWRGLERRRARRASASIMSRPTRCSAICRSKAACSPKKRPTRRPRLIRRPRPRRIISSAPGTTPTACRSCCRIARTITDRIHFPEKLIPLMILNALEGKPLPVYGKGENVRDWLLRRGSCPSAGAGR